MRELASSYNSVCKDVTIIGNILHYLEMINEKIK